MEMKTKKKENSTEQWDLNDLDINEVLDKLLVLQNGNKKTSFLKGTVYVVSGICVVMFVLLICASIYKNSFTTESILSMLLAFFSIFISIFFYFKADETSTKFYDSSYRFMKDISVTLGKIEERFDEKLNSLNDKVSHLDRVSKETTQEIEDKQEDKDSIINELMEKANLNEEEKAKYKQEIEIKEAEIEQLKHHKYKAEREAMRLRRRINESNEELSNYVVKLNPSILFELMEKGEIPEKVSASTILSLRRYGYIDGEGNINKDRIARDLLEKRFV